MDKNREEFERRIRGEDRAIATLSLSLTPKVAEECGLERWNFESLEDLVKVWTID